uniref:ABC transmembrane type-1 domain-containing protein n=1 Tax=Musa acuminata subsp. malaccensis TaxID=214687 RepID=A0A804IU91_MUSAM
MARGEREEAGGRTEGSSSSMSSFWTIFMHADTVDRFLMTVGFIGAVGDGVSLPVIKVTCFSFSSLIFRFSHLLNPFSHGVHQGAVNMLYLACGSFVASFCEGYCWTRTGERQASRMRSRYLKAVMRQDIEYFDLNAGSGTEVITSVSSDSLVVQDAISEKVPNFIMNASARSTTRPAPSWSSPSPPSAPSTPSRRRPAPWPSSLPRSSTPSSSASSRASPRVSPSGATASPSPSGPSWPGTAAASSCTTAQRAVPSSRLGVPSSSAAWRWDRVFPM